MYISIYIDICVKLSIYKSILFEKSWSGWSDIHVCANYLDHGDFKLSKMKRVRGQSVYFVQIICYFTPLTRG